MMVLSQIFVGEISAASQEQSTGIEQVNLAVAQMDEVTQQNAALVEETAAAAQSLQSQATKLTEVVSVFTLESAHQSGAIVDTGPHREINITPMRQALKTDARYARMS